MISVVTCTYNRARELYRGIRTINNQDIDGLEIIVVDDGSIDNTKDVFNQLQAEGSKNKYKYIYLDHPEARISCVPRNIGIKAASGDIIVFTEPEALHVGETINQIVEKMEAHPNSVILASQVWSIGQRIQEKLDDEAFQKPARIISHPYAMLVEGNMQNTKAPDSDFAITGEPNCNAGVLFAAKKDWLYEIGGFDESFTGHGFDDFDVMNRLGYTGHPLLKCPDIAVIHQYHVKNYPYNIYDHAEKNGKISEERIKRGEYRANIGKAWGQI